MGRVVSWAVAGLVALVVLIGAAAGAVVAAIVGTSGSEPFCPAATTTPTDRAPTSHPEDRSVGQARRPVVTIAVGQRMTIRASGLGGACDGGDGNTGPGVPLPPGFTLPTNTPTAVMVAIAWALAQRGTPYTFGGDCTAPHSQIPARQCDCSSLVQQAYRHAGVSLPRTTGEQVHTGTAVTGGPTNLRPGDLIFIPGSDGTMSDPGHVGLYIGSGLIVQAPHTGDLVKISWLSDWVSHIAAIRRVVPD